MLSRNLERSLHQALSSARERQHEFATLEHLLFALVEDQDAIAVLRACGVDVTRLKGDLVDYLDNELGNLVVNRDEEPKPTASFQRVVQRAAIHVQTAGRKEVTGANILIAMFSERESHAVFYLQEQEMSRFYATFDFGTLNSIGLDGEIDVFWNTFYAVRQRFGRVGSQFIELCSFVIWR